VKIIIRAVGKNSSKDIVSLTNEYLKRLPWKVSIEEVVISKGGSPDEVMKLEGEKLLSAISDNSFVIVMDCEGQTFTSEGFSDFLTNQIPTQFKQIVFLIGGAHGHSEMVKKRANQMLSLGKMTYPHMLVRVILAEQLYRAYTIAQNHPYHKK